MRKVILSVCVFAFGTVLAADLSSYTGIDKAVASAKTTCELLGEIKEQAATGNSYAQTAVGLMLLEGSECTGRDLKEAEFWLQKAADQNNIYALVILGKKFYRDDDAKFTYPRRAISFFDTALSLLLEHYNKETSEFTGTDSGFFKKMAGDAAYGLGRIYENKDSKSYEDHEGDPQDLEAARDAFSLAAKFDNIDAMLKLGVLYYTGNGSEKNHLKALGLFRNVHAATTHEKAKTNDETTWNESRNVEAARYIIYLLWKGEGVERNLDEAERMYRETSFRTQSGFSGLEEAIRQYNSSKQGIVKLNAAELISMASEDREATDTAFDGKRIEIEAVVVEWEPPKVDDKIIYAIMLPRGSNSQIRIQCAFEKTPENIGATDLYNHPMVIVQGNYKKARFDIILENCLFITTTAVRQY